jgi:LysR family transcriptional regulator, hca operon transcriptional activator
MTEQLFAILPATHRLAARKAIRPQDLAREIFVGPAHLAPVLKSVINDYAAKNGVTLQQNTSPRTSTAGCRSLLLSEA